MSAPEHRAALGAPPRPLSGSWRWIAGPASIAIASRAFAIVVMVAVAVLRGVPPEHQFTLWDGVWYARIADAGYHAAPIDGIHYDFAFFPAWPLLMRVLTLGFLPSSVVGFIAANVLFVVGAVLVWRLLAERWDAAIATRSVALLSIAPPAYAFSMAYSESLFVAVMAASMLARRAWVAAVFGAIGGATRLAGLALVAAAAAAAGAAREHRRVLLGGLIGAAVGFALWFTWVAVLTGKPLGFFEGSRSWMQFDVFRSQVHAIHLHPLEYSARFAFVGLVLVGSVLAVRHDRQLGLYALAVVGIAIVSVTSVPVQSIARYAMPAFPAYAAITERLGRRATVALIVVFAVAEAWMASWTIGPGRVPP